MYTILTSKPGQFRTEPADDMRPVESWDYLFYGRQRARFDIVEMRQESKVRVIDLAGAPIVNLVPSKFLERFPSVEEARAALHKLASFGDMDIKLVRL
ncbi:MAG: ferredoxin [Burkholderiales bacterium]|nr:ferredoxin [Burkholderiales bacterium]